MNKRNKWTLVSLLLAIVVFGVMRLVTSTDSAQEQQMSDVKVATPPTSSRSDTLHYRDGAPQLAMIQSQIIPSSPVPMADPLSARVTYDEQVTARVGVSVAGRVVALKAEPGDEVKAGQVLAEIDSPDFGAAVADLSKARADEAHKRFAAERAKSLVRGEAIAAKDWEAAQADYAQAKAETARALQRVKSLNPYGLAIKGQRVSIVSPIDGVVTERNATHALEVNPDMSTPLFVVTDPKRLWLMIDVPESLLGLIKVGSDVAVQSNAFPDDRFMAKIVQRGLIVDPDTRRVIIRARVDNAASKLLPEMFVLATVLQDNGTGVRVPNSSIVNQGIHAFVYVQTGPGQFRRCPVKLLTRGSDFSYVGEGLEDGERVVTTGALLLDAELSSLAGTKL